MADSVWVTMRNGDELICVTRTEEIAVAYVQALCEELDHNSDKYSTFEMGFVDEDYIEVYRTLMKSITKR